MKLEEALQNPAKVFSSPQDVCREDSLSTKQKEEILKRWEYDAREMQVAEEENMAGSGSNLLDEVLKALVKIGSHNSGDRSPPTKQGGA